MDIKDFGLKLWDIINKTFGRVLFILYQITILLSCYAEVAFLVSGYYLFSITDLHLYLFSIINLCFFVFLLKLPDMCRLNNTMLLIVIAFVSLRHGRLFYKSILDISSWKSALKEEYVFILVCLIIGFFYLIMGGKDSAMKNLRIDLKAERLKRPIENTSDIENMLLKLSHYAVTISKTDTEVHVKLFDTKADKWIDVIVKLENGIMEIRQKEGLLKTFCEQFINKTRVHYLVENAEFC